MNLLCRLGWHAFLPDCDCTVRCQEPGCHYAISFEDRCDACDERFNQMRQDLMKAVE